MATRRRATTTAVRRKAAPASTRVRAAMHESAAVTRRTVGWRAPTASPNAAILSSLATLRDRSRAATRNNGYAKGAIDKLVSNIVGTGVAPLIKADDPAFRRQLGALWLRWTDESDADGLLDFYGQQAQAVRGWLEGGEAFVRIRSRLTSDGLPVPLQIQIVEPELCPYTYDATLPNGNMVRAGIEFNAIGKRVAYHFYQSRPGDVDEIDTFQLRRVPAESVVHLYDPLRPGQLRGVPQLTQALVKLYELDKFDDATLLRQQLQNMFVGFLTHDAGSESDPVNLVTGEVPATSPDDKPMIQLEPGMFHELEAGDDVRFSDPPDASPTYPAFVKQQLFSIASATGVPYEVLTGDMSAVNDRTVRVILSEFRRRVQTWQHQILAFQFCRRVWTAWVDRIFVSGVLPIPAAYVENPEPWNRVKWMAQGWPYLHPVQDVEATKAAIRTGLTSRAAAVAEQGDDAEVIDAEQQADNVRADALGLRYDSDARDDAGPAAAGEPPAVPAPSATQ